MQNQKLPDWRTCLNSDHSLPLLLRFARDCNFVLEGAKTYNAVFSRRKTKDELIVKCMNIFYLNAWVMLGANNTLILGMGYLGRRSWQLPSLLLGDCSNSPPTLTPKVLSMSVLSTCSPHWLVYLLL